MNADKDRSPDNGESRLRWTPPTDSVDPQMARGVHRTPILFLTTDLTLPLISHSSGRAQISMPSPESEQVCPTSTPEPGWPNS